MPSPGTRPLRADAQRNRERLLETAVRAFTDRGTEASLESIAREAGVGIGTLYRHFPTREALVEAAYRKELGKLCESATELLARLPPDRATRVWMDNFIAYLAAKRGMVDTLRAIIASGGNPFAESRERLLAAVDVLLAAGAADGVLRGDAAAADVLAALTGISLSTATAADPAQSGRLLDLLMDGLRHLPAER